MTRTLFFPVPAARITRHLPSRKTDNGSWI